MYGTIINAAAIVLGGLSGCFLKRHPSAAAQNYLKVLLGAATVSYGLRLVWLGLNGPFLQVGKQLLIVLLALILGRLLGRLLHLQKLSNLLGRQARDKITLATKSRPAWGDGFHVGTALLCAAPLAVLGSVADGLGQHWPPLAIKAVMDGLAALGFVSLFGWSITLAALPVLAYQGTITLLCARYAQPFLEQHGLMDSVVLTNGWLVVFVGLFILEIRRIEMADYLPALAVTPLLTWWWH